MSIRKNTYMLYQVVVIAGPESVGPFGATVGFDRLSFVSPFPAANERTKKLIDQGRLPRFYGPYDACIKDSPIVGQNTSRTCFVQLAWAEESAEYALTLPATISAEIVEIPEAGDPGYVAP